MISITLRWLNNVRIFYPNSYEKTRRNPYKKRLEIVREKQGRRGWLKKTKRIEGLKTSLTILFLENIKHFQVAFYRDCWYNIFVIKKVFYV